MTTLRTLGRLLIPLLWIIGLTSIMLDRIAPRTIFDPDEIAEAW